MEAPRSLSKSQILRLRKFIRKTKWKQASSPRYADAPHAYVVFFDCAAPATWKWFAAQIRKHGVWRTWRAHRYRYLLLDGEAFWIDWPCLNCARTSTLDPA